MKPRLFIGSSLEGLAIAQAVHSSLQRTAEATVWTQGVFKPSESSLESLVAAIDEKDFSLFVFSADDIAVIRQQEKQAVRDNVLFEMGLFVGRLGRSRCFFLMPDDSTELRIPSDLLGMTGLTYEAQRTDGNWQAAVGPACTQIQERLQKLGCREFKAPSEGVSQQMEDPATQEAIDRPPKDDDAGTVDPDLEWHSEYVAGNNARAVELLTPLAEEQTEVPLLRKWRRLLLCNARYRLDQADGIAAFTALIAEDPEEPFSYLLLAAAHLTAGRAIDCFRVLDAGIAITGGSPGLRVRKADYQNRVGKQTDALELLDDVIRVSPEHSDARAEKAKILIEGKDYGAARQVLDTACLEFPNDTELLSSYASLLDEHFDKKLALIPFNRLVTLEPKNQTYLTLRANVYLELELNDMAMKGYREAEKASERKEAWILANIGNLLTNRGLCSESVPYFDRALELEKGSTYTHQRLGDAIKRQEEEEAKLGTLLKEATADLLQWRLAQTASATQISASTPG